MLAFNLGVFFRNLSGAEVEFAATNAHCEFQFVGFVREFQQHQDVSSHLSVALHRGDLTGAIDIEEEEEEALESPEDAKIEVHLVMRTEEGEREVLHTTFRFEDISLKPHVPPAAEETAPGGEPPPKAG